MRAEFDQELSPEVREKMKKNLVYLGIFSVVMLFAGFTSAYIVSMGDSFWVKYDFPPAFYISTALLLISSFLLEVGIRLGQKGNLKAPKIFVPLTLIFGIGFAYFQWKGYGQLVENGAYFTSKIAVTNGRYGDYYELKINGKYLQIDGSKYLIQGKEISEKQKTEISTFAKQFENVQNEIPANSKGLENYTFVYKNQEVQFKDGNFFLADTQQLQFTDLNRMAEFCWHLRDGRGDFYHKGELGKDFNIYYKGKKLDYNNRNLYYKGTKLSAPLQLKMNDSADSATSYLYIITFLHFLHVLVTLIFMMRMSIRSFTDKLQVNNYLTIRSGAIFWHFLGILWLYLLLFLLFIH